MRRYYGVFQSLQPVAQRVRFPIPGANEIDYTFEEPNDWLKMPALRQFLKPDESSDDIPCDVARKLLRKIKFSDVTNTAVHLNVMGKNNSICEDLLEIGVPKVNLIVKRKNCNVLEKGMNYTKQLPSFYGGKVNIVHKKVTSLYTAIEDHKIFRSITDPLISKHIFLTLENEISFSTLNKLAYMFLMQQHLSEKLEHYMIVPYDICDTISSSKRNKLRLYRKLIIDLTLDFKVLMRWQQLNAKTNKRNTMQLVKISRKEYPLLDSLSNEELAILLPFFMNVTRKGEVNLISKLEEFSPTIGPELIFSGLNRNMKVKDILATDLLLLLKHMHLNLHYPLQLLSEKR